MKSKEKDAESHDREYEDHGHHDHEDVCLTRSRDE
jgi:hypothetical protein